MSPIGLQNVARQTSNLEREIIKSSNIDDCVFVSDDEKLLCDGFSCTYYGDFVVPEHPTTFDEAINLCHQLPGILEEKAGKNELYGIPKRSHLLSLESLNIQPTPVFEQVSNPVSDNIFGMLRAFEGILADAADLRSNEAFKEFSGQAKQVNQFIKSVSDVVECIEEHIKQILPKVRSGSANEACLGSEIFELENSIFSPDLLRSWIDGKCEEFATLTKYLRELYEFPRVFDQPYDFTKSIDVRHVLAFSFGRIAADNNDLFVDHLQGSSFSDYAEADDGKESLETLWPRNQLTLSSIQARIESFKGFYNRCTDKEEAMFIVTTGRPRELMTIEPGATFLFTCGKRSKFEIPSSPGTPCMDPLLPPTTTSISLKWSPCEFGGDYVNEYQVFCWCEDRGDTDTWVTEQVYRECAATIKVEPGTTYRFAVAPITRLGPGKMGSFSDPISSESLPSFASEILPTCTDVQLGAKDKRTWHLIPSALVSSSAFRIYDVNTPNRLPVEEKIIMLVGASGSGKTTLINGIINYVFGVKHSDTFRLLLVHDETRRSQAHSQTKEVTAYRINHHTMLRIPY